MAFSQFSCSWPVVLRRGSLSNWHLRKRYGRCVSTGLCEHLPSRGVVGVECAKTGGRSACRKLHEEREFSRERFSPRCVSLPLIFPGDKHLAENGTGRRWMHSGVIPPWQWSLGKASSWRKILTEARKMRRLLSAKEYSDMLEACELRLVELCREGVLSMDRLRFIVKDSKLEGLSLAIGCASRLVAEGRKSAYGFSFEEVDWFFHAVSRHPGHANAGCERLQSIINFLADPVNMRDASSRCILSILSSAAHLNCRGLSLHGLMVGAERLYMNRLHELPPEDLVWLASASSRISKRERDYDCTALYHIILEDFFCRWTVFSRRDCLRMLVTVGFGLPKGSFCQKRMQELLRGVDGHLAPHTSSFSSKEVQQVASVFTQFAYKAKHIPFRDVLYKRMESLKERQLVRLFHYVSVYDVVDESLLRNLYRYISQHVCTFKAVGLELLLTSLASSGVRNVQGCGDCAHVAVEEIVRRQSSDGESFSSEQCAVLLFALVCLNMDGAQAVDMLYSKAIGEFEHLSMFALSQFVFGVSKLKDNGKYAARLREVINRTDLRQERLQPKSSCLICRGLVEMHYAHRRWLQRIAQFSSINLAALMSEDLKGMSIILNSLSHLGFRSTELFQAVKTWLEVNATLVCLLGWCGELINIVWACVAQDVLPCQTLEELSRCAPPSLEKLLRKDAICLHQVSIIAQKYAQIDILEEEIYSSLCQVVQYHSRPLPAAARACVKAVAQLLPHGHVREDLFTPEGIMVVGGLLKEADGSTVKWPNHIRGTLSASEMEGLVQYYRPLAFLVLVQSWFGLSNRDIGPAVMVRKTLHACGWDVLVISTSDYDKAVDKESFLRSSLEEARVRVPK